MIQGDTEAQIGRLAHEALQLRLGEANAQRTAQELREKVASAEADRARFVLYLYLFYYENIFNDIHAKFCIFSLSFVWYDCRADKAQDIKVRQLTQLQDELRKHEQGLRRAAFKDEEERAVCGNDW